MLITYELDLNSFDAWGGAIDTLNRVKNEGKVNQLESILDEMYPEGITEGELNDLLWYEEDDIFSWLGIRSESKIREELNDIKEEYNDIQSQIDDIISEYNDACIGVSVSDKKDIWEDSYVTDYVYLKEQLEEFKEQITELEEELENI